MPPAPSRRRMANRSVPRKSSSSGVGNGNTPSGCSRNEFAAACAASRRSTSGRSSGSGAQTSSRYAARSDGDCNSAPSKIIRRCRCRWLVSSIAAGTPAVGSLDVAPHERAGQPGGELPPTARRHGAGHDALEFDGGVSPDRWPVADDSFTLFLHQTGIEMTSAVDDVLKAVVAGEGRIVVVDVEATCWKQGVFSRKKETIEIGAVLLLLDRAESTWPEFQTVRPTAATSSPLQLLSRAHRHHAGERRCRAHLP